MLRIGLIAPAAVPVPPPVYGGTELVVDHLARGLSRAGHVVVLFTTGDATCPVERRWVHPRALGTVVDTRSELAHVEAAYEALGGCDLIHDHTLLGPLWGFARTVDVPVVATVHNPFTPEAAGLYELVGSRVAIVAISHHQRSTAPRVPVAAVIHHGIDVEQYPLGGGDGGYVLFLGRMSPDKGVHRALAVAKAAGRRLVIAAKMREPEELRYFHEVVEPLLDDQVTCLGEATGPEKIALLAGAEALLNPIRWAEPFGLVMIEALATGTPVLAFAEGAAPEIVEHGRTGFLCADEDDMAGRLAEVGRLARHACRQSALERFSTERMVEDHLRLYEHLAGPSHSSADRVPA